MSHRCMLLFVSTVLVVGPALPGCASGDRVSRSELGQASSVSEAEVLELVEVDVEGERSRKGSFFGFVLGAAAGSTVGSGGGRRVATAVGGVGGAVAGESIEEASTRVRGVEITLRLSTGEILKVVQVLDAGQSLAVGDQVQLQRWRDGTARVTKSVSDSVRAQARAPVVR